MIKKWVSIFCFIFMMVTTVVWAKPDSAYIDNGNGTVTDIETKLMWQQGTAVDKMNWDDAMSYCLYLSLAGYTDWRLPTLDELKTLVDLDARWLKINYTYFPNTLSDSYWSSTTYADSTNGAWGVGFSYGKVDHGWKGGRLNVRAVRGGQPGALGDLVISPLSRTVTMNAGSTTFSVSNTGTGNIPWKVEKGADWLSISSGAGGMDTGTITCAYTAYTGTASRTGTIWVTAYGDGIRTETVVTVTQTPIYVDNGNGTVTVTDTSSSLIWQQATAPNTYNWDQAIAYCSGLSLAGYTDWRLPTLDELKTLVDSTQTPPKINHTFFPDTRWDVYWSSTTYADSANSAWGVYFFYGKDITCNKSTSYYVRAVRGGQTGSLGNLVISPLSQLVTKDASSTIFSVSNTGTGTMPWTAAVTSDSSWLTITSGTSGTNTGAITCDYTANTSTSSRTGTIRVTATGAKGSPTDVTVTQAPTPTACTATTDGNLLLHIPYLSYIDPASETLSFWADLVNEVNPTYPMLILFKLTNLKVIENPSFSCAPSTLSSDFKIHIPDVLSPDGITHLWMDMEYRQALSTDENVYFEVTKFGVVSN